jgi:hypothetical protein
MENTQEILFFGKLFNIFKRKHPIKKGQLGVYHDKLAFDTYNNGSDSLRHNIFVKVKILEVYDQLVEIEVLDFTVSDSASDDIINIVKHNMPKFVDPKMVKWQTESIKV